MIKVLISAPSMNVAKNVSGVTSVVRHIRGSLGNKIEFQHLEIGSEQHGGKLARLLASLAKAARSATTVLLAPYDILHSNTAMNTKSIVRDLAMVIIARLRGKGIVLHIHGGTYVHQQPPKILANALELLFGLSSYIVVLSEREQSHFWASFPKSASKIGFIYNGIDLSQGGAKSAAKSISSDFLKVAFVGRFAPEKGLANLISACRCLDVKCGVRVDFFGDGELLPNLLNLAQESAIVTYRGVFEPSESRRVLRDFDALVLPSLRGEGMPMAIIEAMSVGVVPICSPISSIPEIVTDGETGVLIPIGSSEAIIDAFARLRRDPEARRRISCAAYKFAANNFDASKNYHKLYEIYQKILPQS